MGADPGRGRGERVTLRQVAQNITLPVVLAETAPGPERKVQRLGCAGANRKARLAATPAGSVEHDGR